MTNDVITISAHVNVWYLKRLQKLSWVHFWPYLVNPVHFCCSFRIIKALAKCIVNTWWRHNYVTGHDRIPKKFGPLQIFHWLQCKKNYVNSFNQFLEKKYKIVGRLKKYPPKVVFPWGTTCDEVVLRRPACLIIGATCGNPKQTKDRHQTRNGSIFCQKSCKA